MRHVPIFLVFFCALQIQMTDFSGNLTTGNSRKVVASAVFLASKAAVLPRCKGEYHLGRVAWEGLGVRACCMPPKLGWNRNMAGKMMYLFILACFLFQVPAVSVWSRIFTRILVENG